MRVPAEVLASMNELLKHFQLYLVGTKTRKTHDLKTRQIQIRHELRLRAA